MFAAIYGQLDRDTKAGHALADLLALNPDFANRTRFYLGAFIFSETVVEDLIVGLRSYTRKLTGR